MLQYSYVHYLLKLATVLYKFWQRKNIAKLSKHLAMNLLKFNVIDTLKISRVLLNFPSKSNAWVE